MKIIYNVFFITVVILGLTGCDNKAEFDRPDVISEYAIAPEYSPYSRVIKQQTINEYANKLLISTTKTETDKKNRLINLIIKNSLTKTTVADVTVDYDKLTFNYQDPSNFVTVKNGKIELDNKGRIIKQLSIDGKYLATGDYDGNKITQGITKTATFTNFNKFFWENNLLVQQTVLSSTPKNNILSQWDIKYKYDVDGKMILVETTGKALKAAFSAVLYFDTFNEFGDWTKAKRVTKIESNEYTTILTRDIKYW